MKDNINNWIIGVATALSISALGSVMTLYQDVQELKSAQTRQSEYNAEQLQMRELLINLDKNFAVQAEAFRALTITIEELKREKHVSRN